MQVQTSRRADSSQIIAELTLNRTYQYKPFGDKQIKYVGRGACLKCLSPLGKSSASLGMCKVTSGMAWCPISHMCV